MRNDTSDLVKLVKYERLLIKGQFRLLRCIGALYSLLCLMEVSAVTGSEGLRDLLGDKILFSSIFLVFFNCPG